MNTSENENGFLKEYINYETIQKNSQSGMFN